MGGHSTYQVQEAIWTALNGDSTLDQLLGSGKIFDFVPEGTEFPYITMGNDTAIDWDTNTANGMEHTVVINAWTQDTDRIPLKKIGEAIYNVLHHQQQTITVVGHNLINIAQEFEETLKDPDGHTMRLIQRYRVITHE